MNVLAVVANAPNLPRLASSEELARIQEVPGVSLRTVMDATAGRVAQLLSQEQFDALLWIGHGLEGQLLVQDGRIDPYWLAAQLSSRRVPMAVIATCWSGVRPDDGNTLQAMTSFADALPESGIDTISMQTQMSDRAAIEFDVELFRQLATGTGLRTAYKVALNRAAQYGGVRGPQLASRDGNQQSEMLRALDVKVDEIKSQLEQMKDSQDRLEARVQRLEDNLTAPPGYSRMYLVIGAAVMAVMLFLLLVITWRLL